MNNGSFKIHEDNNSLLLEVFTGTAAIEHQKGTRWKFSHESFYNLSIDNRVFFLFLKASKKNSKFYIKTNKEYFESLVEEKSVCFDNELAIMINDKDLEIDIFRFLITNNYLSPLLNPKLISKEYKLITINHYMDDAEFFTRYISDFDLDFDERKGASIKLFSLSHKMFSNRLNLSFVQNILNIVNIYNDSVSPTSFPMSAFNSKKPIIENFIVNNFIFDDKYNYINNYVLENMNKKYFDKNNMEIFKLIKAFRYKKDIANFLKE